MAPGIEQVCVELVLEKLADRGALGRPIATQVAVGVAGHGAAGSGTSPRLRLVLWSLISGAIVAGLCIKIKMNEKKFKYNGRLDF